MKPVRLSRKLDLESVVQVADGAGGFQETWSKLGEHWAQLSFGRGRIRASGETAVSTVPTEVVVRGAPVGATSRPVPDQRFREGDRCWRIVAVTEFDPSGRYLRCDTIEEVVP